MAYISNVLFASSSYPRYDADVTLPAKFGRMIDKMGLAEKVAGRYTVIKMHLGREIGFTTIHPMFVKILIDKLKGYGAKVYVADQQTEGARPRGYTREFFDCPVVEVCGVTGKYFYPKDVAFKSMTHVDVGGHIHDADFMINLSHAKGHGSCGFGGACKNIAMGCVTDRTRQEIHGLEGGLVWDEALCTHCEQCVASCGHGANYFADGKYTVDYHNCTLCGHCVKVCPTGAVRLDAARYDDFQYGMALCAKTVLDALGANSAYYITFLMNITALCDCWGLSTPSLVPDIGVIASDDLVAIERTAIDAIKFENLLPNGVPVGFELGGSGHLFERLHGKNPYIQLDMLEKLGLGTQNYKIIEFEGCGK